MVSCFNGLETHDVRSLSVSFARFNLHTRAPSYAHSNRLFFDGGFDDRTLHSSQDNCITHYNLIYETVAHLVQLCTFNGRASAYLARLLAVSYISKWIKKNRKDIRLATFSKQSYTVVF